MTEKVTEKQIAMAAEYHAPALDSEGRELVSSVSLVTVAHQRPVTLGERIKRYMQMPTLQADLEYDEIDEDDYVDYDGPPMSKYEDRHRDLLKRVSERKSKEAAEKKAADRKAAEEEAAAFRKRVLEVKIAGSKPDLPPASDE